MPKLVAFDVDGTLIDWNGHCAAETRAALAGLRRAGITVVIATGRPLAIARHTIEQVGGSDWMACGNGSAMFEVATGTMLRDRCLPAEVVVPIIETLRARVDGIGFAVELTHTILEEPGFARRVPEPPQAPPVADVLAALRAAPGPVRRVIPFHDRFDDRLDELAAIVAQVIDDRCQVQFGGLPIVDISPRGDNKAVALQELVEHLSIDATEVLAFGDGRNDIEMLRWAGTGVAMGNAHPEVRASADHVAATVDQGGVAGFLAPLLRSFDTR